MCVVNPEIVVILSLHCLTSLLILHHISCIKGLACLWCSDKNDEQQKDWQQIYLMKISVKTQGMTLRWVEVSSHQALAETSKAFLGDFHGISSIRLFCNMKMFCPYPFPGSVVRSWISKNKFGACFQDIKPTHFQKWLLKIVLQQETERWLTE